MSGRSDGQRPVRSRPIPVGMLLLVLLPLMLMPLAAVFVFALQGGAVRLLEARFPPKRSSRCASPC